MVKIFVPKETVDGERRVAATPESVRRMIKLGAEVSVEHGAGDGCSISDEQFTAAGAKVVDAAAGYGAAQLVLRLHPPQDGELDQCTEGTALLSFLYPLGNAALNEQLNARKLVGIAMDMVPRISRAQKMDALSSQANIAGYKAVIMAADALGKLFPLLMTAAGTITPAKVVIIGAGVAGLQAIATARRLGAVVDVSDIRPAVKEQVESLGARFIDVETDADAEDAGGYAKEASEDYKKRQEEALRQRLREADVLITTAQIPGRPAPKLVSDDMIEEMPNGAVIVDLAAEQGGNCAGTKAGENVVVHGVTIIGARNVPSLVPIHSSDVYAKNVLNLVQHLMKDGELHYDFEDEITKGSIVTKDGEVIHDAVKSSLQGGS